MNSIRTVDAAVLCGVLMCLSTAVAWAGCENKDRPATPTGLGASYATAGGGALLTWQNQQTRTGLTYYDIYVRGPNDSNLGVDVTGGAGQESVAGKIGSYGFNNLPPSSEYNFSMRARTKPGTDGCVSAAASAPVKLSPFHPVTKPGYCLIGDVERRDITNADCKEAQTTGCIRHLLNEAQYAACLRAQPVVSRGCLVAGVMRRDIADADCQEAQQTGCIRRLLTQSQYTSCQAAQKK